MSLVCIYSILFNRGTLYLGPLLPIYCLYKNVKYLLIYSNRASPIYKNIYTLVFDTLTDILNIYVKHFISILGWQWKIDGVIFVFTGAEPWKKNRENKRCIHITGEKKN